MSTSTEDEQQALSYAAVILADSDLEVSADNLLKLTSTAGVQLDKVWGTIYAKALEGQDLKKTLINFNIPTGAAPVAAAPAEGAAADGDEEKKDEESSEDEEEDDDMDMGVGLFG